MSITANIRLQVRSKMWILAIIVLLLIWGNLSKKSPTHPFNRVSINPVYPLNSTESTAGDNFNSGNAIIAGINELNRTQQEIVSRLTLPQHVAFPVAPPPLKIITPQPPLKITPVAPVTPKPPVISRPVAYQPPVVAERLML